MNIAAIECFTLFFVSFCAFSWLLPQRRRIARTENLPNRVQLFGQPRVVNLLHGEIVVDRQRRGPGG